MTRVLTKLKWKCSPFEAMKIQLLTLQFTHLRCVEDGTRFKRSHCLPLYIGSSLLKGIKLSPSLFRTFIYSWDGHYILHAASTQPSSTQRWGKQSQRPGSGPPKQSRWAVDTSQIHLCLFSINYVYLDEVLTSLSGQELPYIPEAIAY